MKRIMLPIVLTGALLAGCLGSSGLDRAVELRAKLLSSSCAFDTVVTADYGDRTYTFTMACEADSGGNVTFEVVEPESIAGITGQISEAGGELTFEGLALDFGILAEGRTTPVSAPWLLIHTMRSGYITAATEDEDGYRVTIDDSYAEDALTLNVWVGQDNLPQNAAVSWEGIEILSLELQNFRFT